MRYLLIFLFIFCHLASGAGKPLHIAVNLGPPWAYFEEGKGITGIDVEIIRKVFNQLGYQTEFHLLAFNRLINDFNEGKYDFASPAAFHSDTGYFTNAYLPYQDISISLASHNLQINTLADLKDKRVIAYQQATSVLGPDFVKSITLANYLEYADREVQLTLLHHDKADLVIGERRILTSLSKQLFPEQKITMHPIFAAHNYPAVAKNQALQQLFNSGLAKIKASGEFQQILDTWP